MPYELKVTKLDKYLYLAAAGRQTLKNNLALADSCVKACKENNLYRVLLDITGLGGQPGTLADYELAKILQSWESVKTVIKVALLENESELAAGKFFETAARNRGINIMVFSDIKKAGEWIVT
jgi:hypothetical protein